MRNWFKVMSIGLACVRTWVPALSPHEPQILPEVYVTPSVSFIAIYQKRKKKQCDGIYSIVSFR